MAANYDGGARRQLNQCAQQSSSIRGSSSTTSRLPAAAPAAAVMFTLTLAPSYYDDASKHVRIGVSKGFVAAIMQEQCKLGTLWATDNSGSRTMACKRLLNMNVLLNASIVH
jgi:hypothetical protein